MATFDDVVKMAKDNALPVGGAAVGYFGWQDHRFLGALLGYVGGHAADKLVGKAPLSHDDKRLLMAQALMAVSAAVGSVKYSRGFEHRPLEGFAVGAAAGAAIAAVADRVAYGPSQQLAPMLVLEQIKSALPMHKSVAVAAPAPMPMLAMAPKPAAAPGSVEAAAAQIEGMF
jgi:hypothetical protein